MSTATQEAPTQNASCQEMPGPVEEHGLLQKFVGEWESEGEAFMAPGQPPTKLKGVESSRMIGGLEAGRVVHLTILRKGKSMQLSVPLGIRPESTKAREG